MGLRGGDSVETGGIRGWMESGRKGNGKKGNREGERRGGRQ